MPVDQYCSVHSGLLGLLNGIVMSLFQALFRRKKVFRYLPWDLLLPLALKNAEICQELIC